MTPLWRANHHKNGFGAGRVVPLDRELMKKVRGLDEHELRRLVIFAQGLLRHREGPTFDAGPHGGKVTYRQQEVRCGKAECTKCPHGPYWYAFWREGDRVRSRYIGRTLPDDVVMDDRA